MKTLSDGYIISAADTPDADSEEALDETLNEADEATDESSAQKVFLPTIFMGNQ